MAGPDLPPTPQPVGMSLYRNYGASDQVYQQAACVAVANQALSGFPTIDGYTVATDDVVLLTDQTTSSQNGLWHVGYTGWKRAFGFATNTVLNGIVVAVMNGTTYGGSIWVLESPTAGTIVDTSAQTWKQSGGSSSAITDITSSTLTLTNPTGPTADIEGAPLPAPMSFVSGEPGTRRATFILTLPTVVDGAGAYSWAERALVTLPVNTTRWRMRFGSWDVLTNTSYTTPVSINGVWAGTPAYSASTPYRWTGAYTATPTECLTGPFTVPVNGTDLVTPWTSALNFVANQTMMLSWGETTTNSGTGLVQGGNANYVASGANNAALAGNQTIAGITTGEAFCDVRLEYEYIGTTPIGLFIGDSITRGYATAAGSLKPSTNEGYPVRGGLQGGYCTINLGTDSALYTTFASLSAYAWSRVDLATCVPDFAVVNIGINDLPGGTGQTALILTGIGVIVANLRTLGINRIFLSTLKPTEGAGSGGTLQAAVSSGATTISVNNPPASVTAMVIDQGVEQETVTVSGYTGTGPYTVTISALANNHALGAYVYWNSEYNRVLVNALISEMPFGVDGVIDFDYIFASPPGNFISDPKAVGTDVHPNMLGYQRMGQLVAGTQVV